MNSAAVNKVQTPRWAVRLSSVHVNPSRPLGGVLFFGHPRFDSARSLLYNPTDAICARGNIIGELLTPGANTTLTPAKTPYEIKPLHLQPRDAGASGGPVMVGDSRSKSNDTKCSCACQGENRP